MVCLYQITLLWRGLELRMNSASTVQPLYLVLLFLRPRALGATLALRSHQYAYLYGNRVVLWALCLAGAVLAVCVAERE